MSKLFPIRSSSEEADQREPELLELDDDRTDEVFDALGSETARQILLELHEGPQPASDLAASVDTTIQNVQYHLTKLEAADLVSAVDTWYAENGAEMDVYAPTDEALVLFAGTEPERSLRKLLKRLVGVLAPVTLGATALALWFDRNRGSDGSEAPLVGEDGGSDGSEAPLSGVDGGADGHRPPGGDSGAGGEPAPPGDATPSAVPEGARSGTVEGTLQTDAGERVAAPENATATDAEPTGTPIDPDRAGTPTEAANGTLDGVAVPGIEHGGVDPTAVLGADPALVAAVSVALALVALGAVASARRCGGGAGLHGISVRGWW